MSCDTYKMFNFSQDSLIRQSLDCNLIPYLLKILDSRMEYTENPSMVCQRIKTPTQMQHF